MSNITLQEAQAVVDAALKKSSTVEKCIVLNRVGDDVDMVEGRVHPQMLYMSGRLKITGEGAHTTRLPRALGLVGWGE